MTVSFTGGTGFVGRAILRELAVRGHRARLLVRDPETARARTASLPGDREFARGDVLDAAPLRSALAGTDAVIHLVGIMSEIGCQTYENVHTASRRCSTTILAPDTRSEITARSIDGRGVRE